MKKKKLLLLTTLAFTMLASTAFIGCKDEETETPVPEVSYEVSLRTESVLMTVGDKKSLVADIVAQADTQLKFKSSDESVATVDEYGWVTAIKEGTVTITVEYGTASDTCEVMVTMNGMSPLLQLPEVPSDTVSIFKSSSLNLNGTVLFNGNTYDDVALTYAVSDPSVGTIENGVFKPAKTGTADITVSGTWRGTSGSTMVKTVTVEIVPEWLVILNDGMGGDIVLYTLDAGTQSNLKVEVSYDGEAVDTNVVISQGEEYIEYDPNAGTVTSKGYVGEAELSVNYEIGGEQFVVKVPVHVKPTMYETSVTNFSAIHGDVAVGDNLRTIVGGTLVSAYNADGTELEVKDDKIYGVPSSNDGKFTTTLTVYTATCGWNLDVEGYSGIIAKAEDLEVFKTNVAYTDANGDGSREFHPIDATKPMQKLEGYYILANNINAKGYDHGADGENKGIEYGVGVELASRGLQSSADYGFFGTFDGQGYTISNMRVRSFGLFGYIVNATVKNVAFANVDLYHSTTYKQTSVLAAWIKNSTISDVYISVKNDTEITSGGGSVFANGVDASSLTRCIVETKEAFNYVENNLTYTGSFTYTNKERMDGDAAQTSFSDVYVISNEVLGYYRTSKTVDNVKTYYKYYIQAENEDLSKTIELTENDTLLTFNGVKKYSTRTAMQAAGNSYTSFNNAYWTVTNGGTPVWKNL